MEEERRGDMESKERLRGGGVGGRRRTGNKRRGEGEKRRGEGEEHWTPRRSVEEI